MPAGATAGVFNPAQGLEAGALAGQDAVVHLAGESISQRWSERAKQTIRSSRADGTRHIAEAVARDKVQTLVSASAIGFYGPRGSEELDEDALPGSDFLAEACKVWETSADPARDAGARVVHPRIGVVLHPSGGALGQMLLPFKMGVGGRVGSGQQYMSWIHRDDLVALLMAAVENSAYRGPVNATAPTPVTNAEFTRALGKALHRPTVFPVPSFALKAAFGEMSVIVLTGQRVLPRRALKAGFSFAHPGIEEALVSLLAR